MFMLARGAFLLLLANFTFAVRPASTDGNSLADTASSFVEFRSDGHLRESDMPEHRKEKTKHKVSARRLGDQLDATLKKKDGEPSDAEHVKRKKAQDGMIAEFMDLQGKSKQACASRLLQAKVFLDKLLKDKTTLWRLISEQTTRKDTNERKLKQAQETIAMIADNRKQADDACLAEYAQGMGDVERYDAELAELRQIANPSVTHEDVGRDGAVDRATRGNLLETDETTDDETAGDSLLQVSSGLEVIQNANFSQEACAAFMDVVHRNHAEQLFHMDAGDDCDKNREKVKEVFVETYKNITELRMVTLHEVTRTKEECHAAALDAMNEASIGPIENARMAQNEINEASNKIDELTPLYTRVKTREEHMVSYIDDELKPTCEAELESSDTMKAIRTIILELAKCPTYKELKLTVPPVVMEPKLIVDLKWHNKNDLDLKVAGPPGTIAHNPTKVADLGFLDHDDNWEGAPNFKALTSEPREAIYMTKAPDGSYTVGVRMFKIHETSALSTDFECELKVYKPLFLKKLCIYGAECEDNVVLHVDVDQRKRFRGTIEGSGNKYLDIMTFELDNEGTVPPEYEAELP